MQQKTKTVYSVKVYFSKDECIEWKNIEEEPDWPDDNTISFTDERGEEITINAPVHLIVLAEKEVPSY